MSEHLYRIGFRARGWVLKAALVFAAAVIAVCSSPIPSAAAATPAPLTVKLSVQSSAVKPGELALNAKLDGGAVPSGSSVEFFVVTKEFGSDMEVPIGTSDLTKTGTASMAYKPTWTGATRFTVHLVNASGAAGPEGSATFNVASASPGPLYAVANKPRPFSNEGAVFLAGLLTAVALVWITLLGTLVRVVVRLPKLAEVGVKS